MNPAADKLSHRDREILRDVVTTFLVRGVPVSSRAVAKRVRHELSAASIRNTMADLEDWGFLSQPHASAGRVPTARGYHLFIDALMKVESPSIADRRMIDASLSSQGDGDDLASTTSRLLSTLSRQVGIVLTPDMSSTVLRRIEFVPLSGRKVLCVSVSESGFVDSKVIETERVLPREELLRASNYLTENFAGQTLNQIRDRLVQLMDDERALMDRLLSLAVSLAQQGLGWSSAPQLVVEGTESLLDQPELANLEQIRRLFDTFTDYARVVNLLNMCMEGEGVRVFIGEESDLTSELDFSLILRDYTHEGRRVGTLGVFGPSRMEYARLIPLVDYLGERLSFALSETM